MSNGWQPSGQQQQQQQGGAYNRPGNPPRPAGPPSGPGYGGGAPGRAYPGQKPPTNGKAIAALVLGISGCCTFWLYGLGVILGIVGLILGILANKEIKNARGTQGGAGMALTGIILGSIAAVGGAITLLLMGFAVASVWECIEDPDAPGCEDFQQVHREPAQVPADVFAAEAAPAVSTPRFWSGPPSAVASG